MSAHKIDNEATAQEITKRFEGRNLFSDADIIALGQLNATLALVKQQARTADALDAQVAVAKTGNLIAYALSLRVQGMIPTADILDRIEAGVAK